MNEVIKVKARRQWTENDWYTSYQMTIKEIINLYTHTHTHTENSNLIISQKTRGFMLISLSQRTHLKTHF